MATADQLLAELFPPTLAELIDRHTVDPRRPSTWTRIAAADKSILQAHIAAGRLQPSTLAVNLPIGTIPLEIAARLAELDMPDQLANYAKRIDAFALTPTAARLIEIKPSASYVALGQALEYHDLLAERYPDAANATPTVLTNAADPDARRSFDRRAVELIEIPGQRFVPLGRPT